MFGQILYSLHSLISFVFGSGTVTNIASKESRLTINTELCFTVPASVDLPINLPLHAPNVVTVLTDCVSFFYRANRFRFHLFRFCRALHRPPISVSTTLTCPLPIQNRITLTCPLPIQNRIIVYMHACLTRPLPIQNRIIVYMHVLNVVHTKEEGTQRAAS
jgi:hypothetical protein